MTAREDAKLNVIELLDPAKHDRAAFSCGITQVDNFFRRTANKLAKADNVRTFVMVGPGDELIGFYATNAHAIDYTELPDRFARNRPAHGSIPAAYISMIGVDSRFQGQGYGGDLLVDCLMRLAGAADVLGIAVVILDVLDCGDPQKVAKRLTLYTSYGFEPLPSNGLRLFLPIAAVRMLTQMDG
ncbi:GNAT family N-acetyltransferase [Altericroceibacterium xinjiangense]|uniref:GNAT family N-acetyltransferase n=1 Tax=Altericroceibacterium xinjiangense TaxID=762261 RepID=UPI000F7DB077|nr:GNAT family N-acetyltransferase [Altericroceibacterium xinjiangense]